MKWIKLSDKKPDHNQKVMVFGSDIWLYTKEINSIMMATYISKEKYNKFRKKEECPMPENYPEDNFVSMFKNPFCDSRQTIEKVTHWAKLPKLPEEK